MWKSSCLESGGSCLGYDNYTLALYTFAMCTSVKVAGIIFLVIAWIMYKAGISKSEEADQIFNEQTGGTNMSLEAGHTSDAYVPDVNDDDNETGRATK